MSVWLRSSIEVCNDEEDHERAIVALRNGYTSEYDEVLPGIFPELPNEASNEAQDIMEMFQALLLDYEDLSAEDKKTIGKKTNRSFTAMALISMTHWK